MAAMLNVTPSVDVSSLKSPVEALPASPQVFAGLIWTSVMFTRIGSLMVAAFGCVPGFGLSGEMLPQPVPCDWSIRPVGPHPNAVKSGGVKAEMVPPPADAAQSRRSFQLTVFVRDATEMVCTTGSNPAP